VPGYAFRSYGGDAYAFGRAGYAAELFRPFVRGRVFAAAGWADRRDDAAVLVPATSIVPQPRTGTMFSVGAGVGLLFDIIRIDVARGLGEGGVWEVIVEANPSFWDFL
jgi:hypothetical protein